MTELRNIRESVILGCTSKSTGNKRFCRLSSFYRFGDFLKREEIHPLIMVVSWIVLIKPQLKRQCMKQVAFWNLRISEAICCV